MKKLPTEEEIKAARTIIAKQTGAIGGRNGWDKLTKEQQQERINKIQTALKLKRDAEKLDKSMNLN